MAGIEPASERIEPRTSTSVGDCFSCWKQVNHPTKPSTSRSDPKVRLRMERGHPGGTPVLWRLLHLRPENGMGRRGLARDHELYSTAYAAKGRVA